VYGPTCCFKGPFQFYFQENAAGSMFGSLTSGDHIGCQITDFVSEFGAKHLKVKLTNDVDQFVKLDHLSNYMSIAKDKIDDSQRILLNVTEVLHQVDVAVRTNLNIPVIADIIQSYFNIWIGIPMQKQSSSVISKMPVALQWWFVKDDEEVKSNKDTLLAWFEKDTKLYQLVKKITEFDNFIDDHDGSSIDLESRPILVIQKQHFDLSIGQWVGQQRKYNEYNSGYDNSWCTTVKSNNPLFIDNDGICDTLHISTWASECQISNNEFRKLLDTCQLIQETGYDLPNMKREYNLLFTLDELRKLLIK
jgi:hypothetical protein